MDDKKLTVMLRVYELDRAGLGSSLMRLSFVVMLHFLTVLSVGHLLLNIVTKIRASVTHVRCKKYAQNYGR